MDFCHSREFYLTNMEKRKWMLLQKTGLDAIKTTFKKEVHKAVESTGEFIGNKITDKIVKPKPVSDTEEIVIEEIVILPEKREEILNELRQVL